MPPTTTMMPDLFHDELVEIEPVTRAATDAADGADAPEDDGGIDVVLSTETPCTDWGLETVLSHERSAIDMTIARKGLTLYFDHGGYPYTPPDPEKIIGFVRNVRLGDDRKLRGRVFFRTTALAQECERDFKASPSRLPFGSIRYLPIKRREERDDQGRTIRQVMTRWRPEEWSLVGIPADANAGRARSAGDAKHAVETETDPEPVTRSTATQEEPMPPTDPITPTAASPTPAAAPATAGDGAAAAPAVAVTRAAGGPVAASPEEILNLCEAHKVDYPTARSFIARGFTLDAAKAAILDGSATRDVVRTPALDVTGIPEKDRRRLSLARAVQCAVAVREGTGRFDGLEAEVHEEIRRQVPSGFRGQGGYWFPLTLLSPEQRLERADRRSAARAMGSTVTGGGAELVMDRMGDLIELQTELMLTAKFGAQVDLGLNGNVQFPVEVGEPDAYFVGENPPEGVTRGELSFNVRAMTPKELIASVLYPRRMLSNSTIDIEARLRLRILSRHARKWDKMGLHGTGDNAQPLGVFNTPGVGTVAIGGVPSYGKLVDMTSTPVDSNIYGTGQRFMTTPLLAGKMKQTLEASAAGAGFIWTGSFEDGVVCGYRAGATKQVSQTLGVGADEHGLAYGDWSSLRYGFWGAFEFIVDPMKYADRGQIIITSNELGDCLVERPQAFVLGTGAKLS